MDVIDTATPIKAAIVGLSHCNICRQQDYVSMIRRAVHDNNRGAPKLCLQNLNLENAVWPQFEAGTTSTWR